MYTYRDAHDRVLGGLQILGDESLGFETHRDVAHLITFAMRTKVQYPFALLQVAHPELTQLLPAQAMIQECRQDGTIAFAF